ncbi:MAG: beta-galactosidase [Verrucomicrobia bacterium]|nr:beta-galactosidase [Verrucomicrobiota bacterium]
MRRIRSLARISLCGALLLGGLAPAASAGQPLPPVRVAVDKRGFVTADGRPFVPFGVNYFRPGTGWAPQLWKQFDADATRRDFARMKDLGVNCVRVFLSFGSFYSEPGRLSAEGLAKFDQFLDMAEAAGIYVHPTGPDHWEGVPAWARGDRLADEPVLRALEQFWTLWATRYRGRAAIFAYDLLNEPAVRWDTPAMRVQWNQWLDRKYGSVETLRQAWGEPTTSPSPARFADVPVPPAQDAPGSRRLLDFQHFREDIADAWTRRQAAAIKAADPRALVTVGLIQWSVPALLPGVQHYAAFNPARQARWLDFMEIHFYPLANGFYEYRGDADETANLAYLESVVRAVAAPGKPVVVAEFGWHGGGQLTIDRGRHPPSTEAQQARWCRRVVEVTSGLATGWLNWGLYDHPEARDVTQFTGLLTATGSVKAWGRDFQSLATRFAATPPAPRPLATRPALDWDACLTSSAAAKDYRDRYAAAFKADPHTLSSPRR